MTKPLIDGETGKVIPPSRKGKHGPEPGTRQVVKLLTMGDVLKEMSLQYNNHATGKKSERMPVEDLTKRIWALRQISQTIAEAERLGIDASKDDDARPMFAGLQITPPPVYEHPPKLIVDNDAAENPPRKGNGHG